MKRMKKFAALILAVVMALTMLTACGGGSSGVVNLGEVNQLLDQQDMDVDVRGSSELTQSVRQVAATMSQMSSFDTTVANALLIQNRNYPVITGNKARLGMGFSVSEQELGTTTVEELVAFCILTLNKSLEAQSLDDYVSGYYVGSTTVTSAGGTTYYVVGIEAEVEKPD